MFNKILNTSLAYIIMIFIFVIIIIVVPIIMFFGYLEVSNFKEKSEAKRVSSRNISKISRPEVM